MTILRCGKRILVFALVLLVSFSMAAEMTTAFATGGLEELPNEVIRQSVPVGQATVSFTGSSKLAPGEVYTYTYKMDVKNAAAANANIGVGGVFEKVSGGTGLFYDTIPNNTTGSTASGSITVRVKADAKPGEPGTLFVKEDESICTTLTGDWGQQLSTVTGSFTAKVAEPPEAPAKCSGKPAGFDAIKVSWSAVPDADGYEVYVATSELGTYSKVYTAESGKTLSYTHTGRAWGKTYYYKVMAYTMMGKSKLLSAESPICSAQAGAVPPSTRVESTSYTRIRTSWDAVPGAKGYEVWQGTNKYGTYSRKHTSSSGSAGSYTRTGLITGKTYYFKVRSYATINGEKVYSDFSTINSTAPGRPTIYVTRASSTSLSIKWVPVSGANGYEVFRATNKKGTYAKKYTASSSVSSWTNKSLTTGKTYYYKVRPYKTVKGKKVYGEFSAINSWAP